MVILGLRAADIDDADIAGGPRDDDAHARRSIYRAGLLDNEAAVIHDVVAGGHRHVGAARDIDAAAIHQDSGFPLWRSPDRSSG